MCLGEVRPADVCLGEVHPAKVHLVKVRSGKVWLKVGVIPSPFIPAIYSLFQQSNLFLIGHRGLLFHERLSLLDECRKTPPMVHSQCLKKGRHHPLFGHFSAEMTYPSLAHSRLSL